MPGMWQRHYSRWKDVTRQQQLDPALLELLPTLAKLCPRAKVIDKARYSAFVEPHLSEFLHAIEADGLIVTGSETDVCVLATVLCAVDLGYRGIVVRDAVCSSSDEGHDALITSSVSATPSRSRSPTLLSSWGAGNPKVRPTYLTLTLTSLSIACLSGRSASQ